LVGLAGVLGIDPEDALRSVTLAARDRIVDIERSSGPGSSA
jgi:hypothetical protein